MGIKLGLIFSGILTFAQAQAFVSPNGISSQVSKAMQTLAKTKAAPKQGQECAKFDGKWKGTCERDGKSEEVAFSVEQQGCLSMSFTGSDGSSTSYDLTGVGVSSVATSSVLFSLGIQTASRWNDDQKVVQIAGSVVLNSPFFQAPHLSTITGQIMFDGQDLVSYARVAGNATEANGETNCRYLKVN